MTTNDLDIIRYTPSMKQEWDDFITRSKNGTFLFMRDYMDYHSDRFTDHSLIFTKGGSIRAVMPACKVGDSLVAHAGLTYGGFVAGRKISTEDTIRFFSMLRGYLRNERFSELKTKPVPHIYHSMPAEEDLYALFRMDARLTARNVSATIFRPDRIVFRKDRNAGARKADAAGIKVEESNRWDEFWEILSGNLMEKYGAAPVHTVDEIKRLAALFPDNIRLYAAFLPSGEMTAGTVLFITGKVVHAQYISADPEGKRIGAVDAIFSRLIPSAFPDRPYFDFGTSNEDGGRILNETLICQKEGFGARAICYDTYTLTV